MVNYRLPVSEYESMIEPRFRISNSYFMKSTSVFNESDADADIGVLVDNKWGDIDRPA